MKQASRDTRERAVAAYKAGGHSQGEVASMFGIHYKTLQNWLKVDAAGEDQVPKMRGHPKRAFSPDIMQQIHDYLQNDSSITLRQMRELIGIDCSISVYWRAYNELGYSYKKKL